MWIASRALVERPQIARRAVLPLHDLADVVVVADVRSDGDVGSAGHGERGLGLRARR